MKLKGLSSVVKRSRGNIISWLTSEYISHTPRIDALSWVNIPLSSKVPRIKSICFNWYRTNVDFNIVIKPVKLYEYIHNNKIF